MNTLSIPNANLVGLFLEFFITGKPYVHSETFGCSPRSRNVLRLRRSMRRNPERENPQWNAKVVTNRVFHHFLTYAQRK